MGWPRRPTHHCECLFAENTLSTDLEHMKCFELNVPTLVPQKVHHHLQICLRCDISGHDGVIGSVKEYFAEEFERLPLGHVVGGENECCVHVEELSMLN